MGFVTSIQTDVGSCQAQRRQREVTLSALSPQVKPSDLAADDPEDRHSYSFGGADSCNNMKR